MEPAQLLSRWLASSRSARLEPVVQAGFSGARLWQVAHHDQRYVLRQWPPASAASRLSEIHELQHFLTAGGLPVPAPLPALSGGTLVEAAGALWELADWRPGQADYRDDPRPEKLHAALHALANIHLAAAEFISTVGQGGVRVASSPSLAHRHARAETLQTGELAAIRAAVRQAQASASSGDELATLAPAALALVEQLLPAMAQRLAAWQSTPLPLQWRLGDVHHDHVLFTGDRVTGVIDFGAAAVEAPAGDVARLLGSLAGNDRDAWRDGLAAYEQVRPLSPTERAAARLFDASGAILSAANWLHWLLIRPPDSAASLNRPAALDRLRTLIARLGAH